MINHNKYNLKEDQLVVLDKDYNNSSIVTVKSFSQSFVYATVQSLNSVDNWSVMTNRLSPLVNPDAVENDEFKDL